MVMVAMIRVYEEKFLKVSIILANQGQKSVLLCTPRLSYCKKMFNAFTLLWSNFSQKKSISHRREQEMSQKRKILEFCERFYFLIH